VHSLDPRAILGEHCGRAVGFTDWLAALGPKRNPES
jgi:hypothetical protein